MIRAREHCRSRYRHRLERHSAPLLVVMLVSIVGAPTTGVCQVAAPMILNHDNANRLIDATSAGSGAQFSYDANGNLISIATASPTALTLGVSQTGQVNVAGTPALLNFTTTAGEPVLSLDLVSTSMSPLGSPIQVNVFNANGTLVGSMIGIAGALLNLPLLPAGTYSVVVEGQDAATGSFQMQLINTPATTPATQPPDIVTTDGNGNTASGTGALLNLTSGSSNSAFGDLALTTNSTGSYNTALGNAALQQNSSGYYNTAVGASALTGNTTGQNNVAVGWDALAANTTGSANSAVGGSSLMNNLTGVNNTAIGFTALTANTTGSNNNAFGANALAANTTGKGNKAQGTNALYSNTTGIRNLGIGSNALYGNVSGSYNIALGFNAGYNQTTGNDTIYIGNLGVAGERRRCDSAPRAPRGWRGPGS
jgi:YD repeat-containing protein